PTAQLRTVHLWLDRLIDDGCVVPRYVNLGPPESPLWARTFRVGEGPIAKISQTMRLLVETLQMAVRGQDRETARSTSAPVPRRSLESLATLALLGSGVGNLAPLRLAEVSKQFGLADACCWVSTGQQRHLLLEWALRHALLE